MVVGEETVGEETVAQVDNQDAVHGFVPCVGGREGGGSCSVTIAASQEN